MPRTSQKIYNGLDSSKYELLRYLISNQNRSELIDAMGKTTHKLDELLRKISYMTDFQKYCFLIYYHEADSFEDAIEEILSLELSTEQRNNIAIKLPDEYFPIKYDIGWFLDNYKDTFLPYGIHDLMINDTYYFRRSEIQNPSIYNYFYHIIEVAESKIKDDQNKSATEKIDARNNLIDIVNFFEKNYNSTKEIQM
jgi:hypothetical protein